jgi:hypothetical protein
MILNEYDSREMAMSRFSVNKKKQKQNYWITFIFFMFQIALIEYVAINIYRIEMLLFHNSVLIMYQLNTQLSFHLNSFYYFICLFAS